MLRSGAERKAKSPRWSSWQNKATTDPDIIAEHWSRLPDDLVGIATGAESGIWVLDLDVKNGKNGFATIAQLCRQHGVTRAPDTLRIKTTSGGEHWYFEHPGGRIKNDSRGRVIGTGVDIRGDGGLVVAPMSMLDGRRYEIVRPERTHDVTRAWPWLEQVVVSAERRLDDVDAVPAPDDPKASSPLALRAAEQRARQLADEPNGHRNGALYAAACHLASQLCDVLSRGDATHELLQACRTNGLLADDGEDQCRTTIASGWESGRAIFAQTQAEDGGA